MPLYSLYRRQRLLASDPSTLAGLNTGPNRIPVTQLGQYCDFSCFPDPLSPGYLYFNSPSSVPGSIPRSIDSSVCLSVGRLSNVPAAADVPTTGRVNRVS